MGMKGVVPALTVFAMILGIMMILIIGQFVYYLLHKETKMEYFLFDIYVVKNGMNLANVYLQNSLDYSVYQAMYDNGRRGGLNETLAGSRYNYWEETGGGINPSKTDLNKSLRTEIKENLNEYTKGGYNFLGKYYTLPVFSTEDVIVNDLGNATGVSVTGDKSISFHDVIQHETGEERISIKSRSLLGGDYPFDYFELYEKSCIIFRKVKSTFCDVLTEGEERTTTEGDFKYTQKVLSKVSAGSTCRAEVMVNITKENSEKFPVFNGTHVTFEPVSMVYIVKIA